MFARIAAVLVAFPLFAIASEELPGVTDETVNGAWEGVVGNSRLVRMEIRPRGQSYLADVFSTDAVGLYCLTQRHVAGGKVFLRFERPNGGGWLFPKVITLEGRGWAGPNRWGAGDLRLTLHQLTGDKGSYPLHLRKGGQSAGLS